MLISQAIAQAAALTGQVVDNAVLVRWLSEIDGRLAFEFYRTDAWTPYDATDDLNCELLVPFPWDGFYIHHLAAQTYFTNGEYDRYENERVMSEKTLSDFRSFMQRTQSRLCGCPGFPTEKAGGTGITVIPGDECHGPWFWLSAYSLAVKHGFKGTEDEWITQLQGPAGPNSISTSTATTLSGVLIGDGSVVGAKALDTAALTDDNDHVPTSGIVKSALGDGGTGTRQAWVILPVGMQIVFGSLKDEDDLPAGSSKDVTIAFNKSFNRSLPMSAQATNRTWMSPENLAITVKELRANNIEIRYKNVGSSAITDTIFIDWAVFGWRS